jgi:hypothetical protein
VGLALGLFPVEAVRPLGHVAGERRGFLNDFRIRDRTGPALFRIGTFRFARHTGILRQNPRQNARKKIA